MLLVRNIQGRGSLDGQIPAVGDRGCSLTSFPIYREKIRKSLGEVVHACLRSTTCSLKRSIKQLRKYTKDFRTVIGTTNRAQAQTSLRTDTDPVIADILRSKLDAFDGSR